MQLGRSEFVFVIGPVEDFHPNNLLSVSIDVVEEPSQCFPAHGAMPAKPVLQELRNQLQI